MARMLAPCLVLIALLLAGVPAMAAELTLETRLSTAKTVQEDKTEIATAECKADEVVVGGGFKSTSSEPTAGLSLLRSEPIGQTKWEVEVVNNREGTSQDFVAIARCLRSSDSTAMDDQPKCCSLETAKTK